MSTSGRALAVVGALGVLLCIVPGRVRAQDAPPPPPARAIPGITVPDPFPQACVSCHAVLPDGMDVRLSTLMKQWMVGADSLLLAVARSAAPAGLTLTGRHPDVSGTLTDIPATCLTCHAKSSTTAPPFTRLMHRIHLTGGDTSIFLSMFQGECTLCHKLDLTTGAWSIPSGPEP